MTLKNHIKWRLIRWGISQLLVSTIHCSGVSMSNGPKAWLTEKFLRTIKTKYAESFQQLIRSYLNNLTVGGNIKNDHVLTFSFAKRENYWEIKKLAWNQKSILATLTRVVKPNQGGAGTWELIENFVLLRWWIGRIGFVGIFFV